MSLIVSLPTPDGIVIAGDSLASTRDNMEVMADVTAKCPKCGDEHDLNLKVGGLPIPATTLSYAQKIFPFMGKFAVGTAGLGQVGNKTMYFLLRELETELSKAGTTIDTVTNATLRIQDRIHSLVKKHDPNLGKRPDNYHAVSFLVAGYDNGEGKIMEIRIGKKASHDTGGHTQVLTIGDQRLCGLLFQFYGTDRTQQPILEAFSLQDAIDYATFLIRTTADHQRFARSIPTVGGDIDVALVTPFDGFRWIKQKPLTALIDPRTNGF